MRGKVVRQSSTFETQAAVLELSVEDGSLPRSPAAVEMETNFEHSEATREVAHLPPTRQLSEVQGRLSHEVIVIAVV